MIRNRALLGRCLGLVAMTLPLVPTHGAATASTSPAAADLIFPAGRSLPEMLPETGKLESTQDIPQRMLAGLDAYLNRELAACVAKRAAHWKRQFTSHQAYADSVARNRERFRMNIGAIDPRVSPVVLDGGAPGAAPRVIAEGAGFRVLAVRWPVLDAVHGEGLLLEPKVRPVARIVVLPDADVSPEQLVGLSPGVSPENQFAKRLAENGCLVLVPLLIDRRDTWSGNPAVRFTNQTHREFLYRAAFQMGRHLIGYEVQKIQAAVDWFVQESGAEDPFIAAVGHGEGGLLALYSAAIDRRIDATLVSGYFQERERIWQEPIYRNVWSLLREFGDAELAGLIAPRWLTVEAARGPEIDGPPPMSDHREGAAPGQLISPRLDSVRREVRRARSVFERLGVAERLQLLVSEDGQGPPLGSKPLEALLRAAGVQEAIGAPTAAPNRVASGLDPEERLRRQFTELNDYTQRLIDRSPETRRQFWSQADQSSSKAFIETSKWYRDYLHDEVFGRLPELSVPAQPRTQLVYNEPSWCGYEVVLDVYPSVIASGVLLLPKDLQRGERRPVVVCQHGSWATAHDTIRRDVTGFGTYQAYAARLADRGFIVYAPLNPYALVTEFQDLHRKAAPLKLSHFSFITRQHERTLDWLAGLPFVDPKRIGFYGLSFGGKTAVRVPPLLHDRYALSICSADFTDWILKTASTRHRWSYMFTVGWSIYEFDLGTTFNYAELASLMVPRPFMVERGRRDGVGPDEWVASEFSKVKALYDRLGLEDRIAIEYFDGPHTIHGVGTFQFLHRHLSWPEPR